MPPLLLTSITVTCLPARAASCLCKPVDTGHGPIRCSAVSDKMLPRCTNGVECADSPGLLHAYHPLEPPVAASEPEGAPPSLYTPGRGDRELPRPMGAQMQCIPTYIPSFAHDLCAHSACAIGVDAYSGIPPATLVRRSWPTHRRGTPSLSWLLTRLHAPARCFVLYNAALLLFPKRSQGRRDCA